MRGGLRAQVLAAGGVVLLGITAIFVVFFFAIRDLRDSSSLARDSADVIAQANGLEKILVDIQTGQRGYVLTGDESFLGPWDAGRAAFPAEARRLERLVSNNPSQETRAQEISRAGRSYIADWSIPAVEVARTDLDEARALVGSGEGKRRFDAIRAQFDAFAAAQRSLSSSRVAASKSASARAEALGAVGLACIVLLVFLFAVYVGRKIIAPIRRLSDAAGQMAGGDLTARVPAGGKGEVRELTEAFNSMATAVEERQLELDRFFSLALEMLCIADLDGYFKRLNPAFEKTLGYTAEELLSKPFLDFVHPDDREATLAEVEKLSRGAHVIAFENRYRCKDGSYKWILWNSTALPDEGLIYAAARDVTERKLAEEQISALNRGLEDGAVELEHQNTELEQQALELETQQAELESAFTELAAEKELVEAFYAFGQKLLAETELDTLAETILRELADFAEADVGAFYAVTGEMLAVDGPAVPRLVTTRGIDASSLSGELLPGHGLAGRALAERRLVQATSGETGLRLVVLGEEVDVQHELHVPLLFGNRAIGVVTLARIGGRPFPEDGLAAIQHVTDRAALALANALAVANSRRLASTQAAVLDASREGIRLVDLKGRTLLSNRMIEHFTTDVFGLPRESTLEERSMIAERLQDPGAYLATMERIAADPGCETLDEFELVDTGRSFERFTAPVRDQSGALIGRIITVRETTAERAADRLRSELVATVSHELRTPLSGILGFAELLLNNGSDEAKRRRYVETVYGEAKRLSALIDDFLDLQKIEAGGFTLSLESFDLAEVLRDQVELFSWQNNRHTLTLELPESPLVVLGERERLAQVVANLLSNAIKYSPDGGRVTVGAEAREDEVRVSVADSGLGIPAAQQGKIFTKFFRADSSDTRQIGGTGLGLALCQEIITAHGGGIGFESVEGAGSTFWFELATGGQRAEQTRPRVLVIEDDSAGASPFADMLGDEYAVEVVASGASALERARRRLPDLVCLDLDLPSEPDGLQTLARLRASPSTAAVPVIVFVGASGQRKASVLGASDVLVKPISPEQLRRTVGRLLPAKGGSLLVVDDEESVRRLVRETLSGNGLELREAADGEEALTAISARRPDAIILDLLMPKLDGFGVLECLRADPETRELPVVILTARRLSAQERKRLKTQALAVLEKGAYSPDELRRLVDRALGR